MTPARRSAQTGRRVLFVALIALLGGALSGCGPRRGRGLVLPPASPPATVTRQVGAMGTTLDLSVTAPSREAALAASEAAVRAVEDTEDLLSTWREDTELGRLNRAPVGTAVALTPWVAEALAESLSCAQATRGAFDPTLGALVEAWGLRTGGRRPSGPALAEARARVGWMGLEVTGREARRRGPVTVEEGGFGKGVALDRALVALSQARVLGATLSLGGQVARLGEPVWVPLAHPERRDRPWLEARVPAGSLATTGNAERGIILEGERRSHVLDPRTGAPAPDWGSVSVWSAGGGWADCLSTGLYVLGPREALAFATRQPGVEVVVVDTREARAPVVLRSAGVDLRCAADADPDCADALARGARAATPMEPSR